MLTVSEAARRAGVPRSTMAYWVVHGLVQGLRIGRFWAIPEREVERVQAQGRPRPGPKPGQQLTRRYSGACAECGRAFQSARAARFCSPRCSARRRPREPTARRRGAAPPADGRR